MKRVLSVLLILCLCFTSVLPMTAFAADMEIGFSDSGPVPDSTEGTEYLYDGYTIEEPVDNTNCDTPQISPFSGFVGEDNEYFTRIRLIVTDSSGNPLYDAVYGLYTMSGQLLEYLITDYSGVAISGDVSVYTDYYIEEISSPEGFIPNMERRYIYLTEICAPSLVGVSVEYDPVMGHIMVIKTDEYGNPLQGAGFHVYRADTWELVDEIITGWDGIAVTVDLPYGWYELYEYIVPEYYESEGYYTAMIEGDTTQLHIVNYYCPPYEPPEEPDEAFVCVHKTGSDGNVIPSAVFSIYSADGFWIEDITTDSSGYAYSSALPFGDYYLIEQIVPDGYILDDTPLYFTLNNSWETVYIDIVNERIVEPGRVNIIKTDDSGNLLSGVVFGLYRVWDGAFIEELTTGADGTAESDLLNHGDYYLVELSGKDGYEMIAENVFFIIDGSGKTVNVSVVNPRIRIFGKVQVVKLDDSGNPLPGVRFGLYCHKDNLLQELVTDADGTAVSGVLNAGDYYLVEIEGLPDYVPDGQKYPFSISENSVTVPVTVINSRITGSVKVTKTGDNDEPLSGVVFGIYQDGVLVEELTTGVDETAESGTLYYGNYELRELTAVEGYELLDVSVPFSILEDGAVIEIPITNPLIYGSVTILKTDEYGSALSGAVFGLYNGQEQLIAELTTGVDGTVEINGLVIGSYYLREISAPIGYEPIDYDIPFNITTQGEVFETTIVNAEGCGTLRVIKTGLSLSGGEQNEPLSGVVFKVYRTSDDELITEIVTNFSGIAEIELPLGAYYLLETQTAEGYMLPEGGFSFALTEHEAVVELSIQNQKEPEPEPENGILKLIKLAEDTEEPLPDAVFGVFETDTNLQAAELTTGTDGTAITGKLPIGNYYLLELTAPSGYELKEDKINITVAAGETNEIIVYNTPETSDSSNNGKLSLIKEDEDTNERLSGAVFGIYISDNDQKIAEITTGTDGTAVLDLPEGSYYLLELTAPSGYELIMDSIKMTINSNRTTEITVYNTSITDDDTTGLLRVTKKDSNTYAKLSGVVFGIYNASDDEKIAEIKTGSDGTVSYELDAGRYYLLELKTLSGYVLSTEKTSFRIKTGNTTDLTILNTLKDEDAPVTGNLYLMKKAEGTGAKLSGAVFGVYSVSGDKKISEITTGSDGTAVCELEPGDYYLRELKAPDGFILESAKIPFTIKADTTVKVEVTNMRKQGTPSSTDGSSTAVGSTSGDGNSDGATGGIPCDDNSILSGDGNSASVITVPKTGESFPAMNYLLSVLFLCAAAISGRMLYKKRGRKISKA